MNRSPLILIMLLMAMASPAVNAQDKVDLRSRWKTGQTSRYRVTETSLTTFEAEGLPEAQRRQMLSVFSAETQWSVLEALPDGGGQARLSVMKMKMEMTGPDGETHTITPDTNDERFETMVQWMRALADHPLTYAINADGTIASVEGGQAVKNAAGELGERLEDSYFREVGSDLAALTGGAAQLDAGSTWSHRHSGKRLNAPEGDVDYETQYTLAGVEQIAGVPIAMIQRQTSIRFTPELPELPADAPAIDIRLVDQSNSAQLLYDRSRAELVGANDNTTLVFEIKQTLFGRQITTRITEKGNTQLIRISEQ